MTDSKDKPLHVRCAEALGCKPVRSAMLRWYCACHVNFAPHRTISTGPRAGELAPYGENTPEGWACTGPLIERFGLDVCLTVTHGWMAIAGQSRAYAASPCAAVAEWVAKFGAQARAKEADRG